MLEVKRFDNRDICDWIAIWSNQAERYPEFLSPMTYRILESQVLGNSLFDPNGVFIARIDGEPVGVIHAAFGPNDDGSYISRNVGIIYPPIIREPLAVRREISLALITACENYFRNFGTSHIFAGGYANSSPFYTGLYGWTNPQGICEKDHDTIGIFRKMGYRSFHESRRFRLTFVPQSVQFTPKIQKAHREVMVTKLNSHNESSWWDRNIYRNFYSSEWNAYPCDQSVPGPIAGAVFREMIPTYSLQGRFEISEKHYILEDIGVLEHSLRRGIASLVLVTALSQIGSFSGKPFVVDTVADAKDFRLIKFLLANNFQEAGLVRSFVKILK